MKLTAPDAGWWALLLSELWLSALTAGGALGPWAWVVIGLGALIVLALA